MLHEALQELGFTTEKSRYGAYITRETYDRKREHDQAGTGTPMKPEAEGVWFTYYDPLFGTTLVTGARLVEATS